MDDFDPANILIATGELDEDGNEIFVPIEISDGTPTGVGDDTALYGHDGSDIVQLDGTSGSHIFTRDGDDTVTGTAETSEIYTGDGDDVVSLTGLGLDIHGGAGNDGLSATEGELWGDAGDDTLTHLDSGGGDATLNGGLGHDTLIGQSGDTFRGGEDITIDINDPLDPGTSHGTAVSYDDGYDGWGDDLDPSGAPFDSSYEDGTLTLNFPEGATGTLHIINEQANGDDGDSHSLYSINQVYIYYVPEGEVFDPNDLSNATEVANLRLDIVRSVDAHDAFTFPDYDTYLTSNLSIGSVQTEMFDTNNYGYDHH